VVSETCTVEGDLLNASSFCFFSNALANDCGGGGIATFACSAQGRAHPVNIDMPAGITVATPTATEIVIKGADRQRVGQIAAEIRAVRPPEPYKGKGIRYSDEKITIKETKKK